MLNPNPDPNLKLASLLTSKFLCIQAVVARRNVIIIIITEFLVRLLHEQHTGRCITES